MCTLDQRRIDHGESRYEDAPNCALADAANHEPRSATSAGNMFDGRAKLEPLDNDRYPSIRWTTARDVLSARQVS